MADDTPGSRTASDRLRDVQKSDLTESRVNQDFVDWLKKKGPTWLFTFVIALGAYFWFVRFQQSKDAEHQSAWIAYFEAQTPGSFNDVADQYGHIDGISTLCRLRAGDLWLGSVQFNRSLVTPGGADNQGGVALTPEERTQNLEKADAFYIDALQGSLDTPGYLIHVVSALNGRAAVAEARGDGPAARSLYEEAADHAAPVFPGLAERARYRAVSAERYAAVSLSLPSRFEILAKQQGTAQRRPVTIDPALRGYLFPDEHEEE